MLTEVDRVQVVVPDRARAAESYRRLLDTEITGEEPLRPISAHCTILRLGSSEVELLEPDGAGTVADFLGNTGGGLFAAGLATKDLAQLERRLSDRDISYGRQDERLFLAPEAVGGQGLRLVITPVAKRERAGLVESLYEVTNLVGDVRNAVDAFASLLALDEKRFVPIHSEQYGYEGLLTLFDSDRLDRIEIIRPSESAKTMGRFFSKRGPSLYMCFAEAAETGRIRSRLLEHAAGDWTGPAEGPRPDTLFIHPQALAGVMLGISRSSFAWTWSSHPERVEDNPDS